MESAEHDLSARSELVALPRAWKTTFWLEIPIVGLTVIYWFMSPSAFLADTFGIEAASTNQVLVLYSYASVVATMVFWFYLRLLLQQKVHLPTFRLYQEALFIGDVGIVAIWFYGWWFEHLATAPALGGLGMALFWGSVRLLFLRRSAQIL